MLVDAAEKRTTKRAANNGRKTNNSGERVQTGHGFGVPVDLPVGVRIERVDPRVLAACDHHVLRRLS
jgi:hypothetical protein